MLRDFKQAQEISVCKKTNFLLSQMYLLPQFAYLRFCYQGSTILSTEPYLGVEGAGPNAFEW